MSIQSIMYQLLIFINTRGQIPKWPDRLHSEATMDWHLKMKTSQYNLLLRKTNTKKNFLFNTLRLNDQACGNPISTRSFQHLNLSDTKWTPVTKSLNPFEHSKLPIHAIMNDPKTVFSKRRFSKTDQETGETIKERVFSFFRLCSTLNSIKTPIDPY